MISSNLLYTDTHDLETLIIKSSALEKVIAVFGSEAKINEFEQGKEIRQVLIEAGLVIGYLRWVSQSENLNLTFNTIEFSKLIDQKSLKINMAELIKQVKNKSQAWHLKDEDLKQLLINKRNNQHDPWQICCGHDLVKILSLALRKTIGTNQNQQVESQILEKSLMLAYE